MTPPHYCTLSPKSDRLSFTCSRRRLARDNYLRVSPSFKFDLSFATLLYFNHLFESPKNQLLTQNTKLLLSTTHTIMKLTAYLVLGAAMIAAPVLAVDKPPSDWKCNDGDKKCLAGEAVGECRAKGWHVIEACPGPYAKCVDKPKPRCVQP
jgi:hypothetical protein